MLTMILGLRVVQVTIATRNIWLQPQMGDYAMRFEDG